MLSIRFENADLGWNAVCPWGHFSAPVGGEPSCLYAIEDTNLVTLEMTMSFPQI